MYKGKYIGKKPELYGKEALVHIEDHEVQDMIPAHGQVLCSTLLAQFDDVGTGFGYGWHSLPKEDFKILYKIS